MDCHGNNPQPKKSEVAVLCAKCHSDLNYMRKFNPQMRVDQLTEYRTSTHGMRNALGDEKVATCTSCHSVHDIRAVRDPKSPVYPSQVAVTCSKCHADPNRMTAYKIPTDQFANYSKSEHAAALLERHDLGAPTCNDCHGNHGARPPGVDSVASVCGQCHRQEKDLFGKSPHAKPFQDLGLAGCVVCHDNHEIKKTDDRMLSAQGDGVCATCHSDNDSMAKIRDMQLSILGLRLQIDTTSEILGRAERAGMEVSKPKFDLEQAHAELIKSRVSVHGFSPEKVKEVTSPAMKMAAAARSRANTALEELGFRRRGLGYALVGIAIMIAALLLKIREIESS
jgi:predicted CXXCH cytochrome family protein